MTDLLCFPMWLLAPLLAPSGPVSMHGHELGPLLYQGEEERLTAQKEIKWDLKYRFPTEGHFLFTDQHELSP